MNTLQKLDLLRYQRKGAEIESLLSGNPESRELSSSFKMSLHDEMELFQTLNPKDVEGSKKILKAYLEEFAFDRPEYAEEAIESLIKPIYCAEALEDSTKTKQILSKMRDLASVVESGYIEGLKNQPYRLRLYIEMYLAKCLEETKTEDSKLSLQKFEILLDIILKYIVNGEDVYSSLYQSLHKSDKSILFIVFWRVITLYDKEYEGMERLQKRVHLLLNFCTPRFNAFFDNMKKIMILYTLNQTIIPFLNLSQMIPIDSLVGTHFPSFHNYIAFFLDEQSLNTLRVNELPNTTSWKQFVMLNFLLMNQLVARTTNKAINVPENFKMQAPSLDDINTRLYPFNIINLNEIKNKVKKLAHEVKDHKYLTLFMGFLIDYFEDNQFLKAIVEDSVILPLDDKLVIKTLLCLIFYLEADYFKCYQCIYQVLEREKPQDKNTFVITHLATQLCLKYLDKPEEALVFAKSNLDYAAKGPNVKFILKREVLYACAGLAYEGIAVNTPFFVERMENYTKGTGYFELSYKANPANQNVLYHLGLLHATIHNFDTAYKYIKEALSSRGPQINVYMLLILLSTAMGDYKKAGLVLEELLPDNRHPLLFVLKAFLEIENYLAKQTRNLMTSVDDDLKDLKLEKEEEINENQELMREISQEIHLLFKSAAICILNSAADDIDLPSVVSLTSKYEHQEVVDYQNLLMLGVEAFVRIKDYSSAEILLDLSKMKNLQENEYLFYKGLIWEMRREYDKAKEFYDSILLKTSTFYKAYLHLGIIHLTNEEKKDLVAAKKELEEAMRYEENSEVL